MLRRWGPATGLFGGLLLLGVALGRGAPLPSQRAPSPAAVATPTLGAAAENTASPGFTATAGQDVGAGRSIIQHPQLPPPVPTASPAPFHVGLQVGHWHVAALPFSLARLRDQTGTFAANRSELSLNLDFAQRTARLLERAGVRVDLLPATVPNNYPADAFVAIHADGNFARPVRGYKIAPPWRSAVAWSDAVLVAQLDAAYSAATGLPRDPGITDNMRGYYAINTWMGGDSRISDQTPGAVIETGFMTSAADRAVLFDQPDRVAAGLVAGILAFLHTKAAADTVQQRAVAVAATSITHCSVVVLRDAVPIRAAPDPGAPALTWMDRSTILPYLDSTARPQGPFTDAQGRQLAVQTGYYRVDWPGGAAPGYINRATVVVQLPTDP